MKSKTFLTIWASGLVALPAAPQVHADPSDASWRGESIAEFDEPDLAEEWRIVNDGVMGGLSKGHVAFSDNGVMKFHGDLSLENNGGFSLVEKDGVRLNLSNDLGILLKVKGDGRTYEVRLESDALYRGRPVSFAGKFETTSGNWDQVKIPFDSFRGGWRGVDLPDAKLNPADIRKVGIILADKQPGSFEVEIDWIRTYGKGKGEYTEAESAAESTEAKRLTAILDSDERFSTMKTALDTAGLTTFFQWDNPLTVFAPTNEAFEKLPEGTLEILLKPENKEKLVRILSHHVSPGAMSAKDVVQSGSVKPVKGATLTVSTSGKEVFIGDAKIIEADINAFDGVIHAIDSVLLPE